MESPACPVPPTCRFTRLRGLKCAKPSWGDTVETAKLAGSDGNASYRVGYAVDVDADTDTVFAGSLSLAAYSYQISAWSPIPDSGHGEANATSYTVSRLTDGLDYAFRVRAVNDAGFGTSSAQVGATAGCPCLTVTSNDNDAIVGQRVQLTASVAPADTEVSEYGWQRWFGEWRGVGPNSSSKGLKFDNSQTNKYRAVVTLPSGSTVVSGSVTVSWRLPEVTAIPSSLSEY